MVQGRQNRKQRSGNSLFSRIITMSWSEFLKAFQVKMLNKPRIRDKVADRISIIDDLSDPDMKNVGGKYPFIGLMIDDVVPDYEEKQHVTEDVPLMAVVYQQKFPHDPQLALIGPGGLYTISEIVAADVSDGGMNNDIDYDYTGPDIIELHCVRIRRPERIKDPKVMRQIIEFQVVRENVLAGV
jgi:hypothetical protein